MKVTIDGSTYFLQTTGANELMNASDLGTTLVVRGVALEHDTVASTRSVIDVDLLKGLRKSFPPGTPFVKLFRVGNRLCIRSVETGDVGWIPASRSFSFTKYGNVLVSPSTTHAHVLDIVTQKIAESNTIWRAIYQELNRESGRGLPPPSWTATEMPNSIVCDLLHPPGQGGARGSNRYLAIDLENRLLGSQCRVISTNDRIIIQYP
jgi:hypothetical protein